MTTGEAIRAFCKECVNSNATKDRQDCGGEYVMATKKPCPLFEYRVKGKGNLRAIRKNCIECAGGIYWVDDCRTETCPLYDFRMGKHPKWKNRAGRSENFPKQGGLAGVSRPQKALLSL